MIKRVAYQSLIMLFLLLVNNLVQAHVSPDKLDSRAWLSDIADPSLQACIKATMIEQEWDSPSEVQALTCHSMEIQSLSGLVQFSALETLSLYNNQIADLGSELDSMLALKVLNLGRNRLRTILVGRLPSLRKLYLFDNGAESLILRALPKLALLKANNNRLVRFEYDHTPALEKVYIFNNELEHLNIYNLPSLGYMDCRQNPMPDKLYDEMDKQENVVYLHDGNAEDWN